MQPLNVVIGESKATQTGLHRHLHCAPPYLEKRKHQFYAKRCILNAQRHKAHPLIIAVSDWYAILPNGVIPYAKPQESDPSERYMTWAWKWRKHQALGEKHHSVGEKNLNHSNCELIEPATPCIDHGNSAQYCSLHSFVSGDLFWIMLCTGIQNNKQKPDLLGHPGWQKPSANSFRHSRSPAPLGVFARARIAKTCLASYSTTVFIFSLPVPGALRARTWSKASCTTLQTWLCAVVLAW